MQIFVLSSSRIQQRGYDTLFKYTTGNPKSGVARLVKKAPLKAQVGCSSWDAAVLKASRTNPHTSLLPVHY